jgi:hypothetical protein
MWEMSKGLHFLRGLFLFTGGGLESCYKASPQLVVYTAAAAAATL